MTEDNEQQSPFTRGGFVAAAVVVALIVVLGIVIVIVNATRDDPEPTPTTSTSAEPTTAAPTSEPTEAVGGASVCGLAGEVTETARLTSAPTVDEWAYQGTIGYPTSAEFGPGKTSPEGIRTCFQRSPTGALFMAANAVAQGSDPATAADWVSEVLAEGLYHDQLLGQVTGGASSEGSRLRIEGFRILKYDGVTARVDLGTKITSGGQNITASAVYELVWQDGDWKISSDVQMPLDAAMIPDLAGYIPWGE